MSYGSPGRTGFPCALEVCGSRWSQSALCAIAVGVGSGSSWSELVEMPVSGCQCLWNPWKDRFSMCVGGLWWVEDAFPWVEKVPDVVSRHCVPLQWVWEVGHYGLSWWKWL